MSTVLSGQDSVSPSGMNYGLSVYAGYGRGTYTNMASVMSRFPGKKYVSISPYVTSGVDCLDVEPGDATAWDTPAFVRGWHQVNTVKPVIYANASTMSAVINALSSAGIARSQYFLWVAKWDWSSNIPSGYDAKQYDSTSGYDGDSFYDYMFSGTVTPAWPLKMGSTGAEVTLLQSVLNKLAKKIGLKTPLAVDGTFGPATVQAVQLAQRTFGYAAPTVFGEVSEAYFAGLEHQLNTGNPPPPVHVPNDVCAPVTNLKMVGEGPHSYKIEFSYLKESVQPAKSFEIVVSQGSHLGKIVPSYPRSVKFTSKGTYSGQFGGVDTRASDYVVAVRALAANGHHASEWTTVKLPKK